MKRLYGNLFSLILLVAIICILLDYMSIRGYTRDILARLTDSEEYFVNNGPDTINPIIRKAQEDDGTTKLIIGDSVANQMFSDLQDNNPDYAILPGNAGVTMAGQYVIAKEYIDNHPGVTDVYLFTLPESLGRTFDTQWGYQYAVLPFIETHTLGNFDDNTVRIMEDTYGKIFMNEKVAFAVDKSGINRKLYFNYLRDKSDGYELTYYYELADQYLCKLNDYCKERNINFYLYPCPVSEAKREMVREYEETYKDSDLYALFPDYYEKIYYYPAEMSGDDTHMKSDDGRVFIGKVMKEAYGELPIYKELCID